MNIKLSHILIAAIFTITIIGVSRAYALTGPRSTPPAQSEINTPINNSDELQYKKGALITSYGGLSITGDSPILSSIRRYIPDVFPGDSDFTSAVINNGLEVINFMHPGTIFLNSTKGLVLSPWLFATNIMANNIVIGGADNQNGALPPIAPLLSLTPQGISDSGKLKINLINRGTANNSIAGTQAISINAGSANNGYTTIRVNGFRLLTTTSGQPKADMIARKVRLTEGYPHQNSVLTGIQPYYSPFGQSEGQPLETTWATIQVENGQLKLVPNTQ